MSNAISTVIPLDIPSWHGIVESIPQDQAVVHNALRKALEFQEALENLSPSQYNDPILAGQINLRLAELGNMVGLPTPDITEAISVEGRAVISNEGIGSLFMGMIKKVLDWLTRFKDWILELLKKSKVSSKAQEAASSSVKKHVDRIVNAQKSEQSKVQGTFAVTARTLVIFHTPAHTPQIDYKYNVDNLRSSFDQVMKYTKVMKDAMEDDIVALILGVNVCADAVMNDKPIPSAELFKINSHRKLQGLAHNKFELIGFGLETRPVSSDFSVRKDKIGVTNVARDYGWYNEGTYELQVSSGDIKDYVAKADKQITDMNKLADAIQDQLSRSNVTKRIDDLKKYADTILKQGSDLEPAQQTMFMKRLLSVQELVMQLQLNVQTFDLFVKNYNNLLIAVGSSTIGRIQSLSDALDSVDKSI